MKIKNPIVSTKETITEAPQNIIDGLQWLLDSADECCTSVKNTLSSEEWEINFPWESDEEKSDTNAVVDDEEIIKKIDLEEDETLWSMVVNRKWF